MSPSDRTVTELLKQWSNGQSEAFSSLAAQVYEELRKLASSYLRHERPGHTLQATALVNEAFLKLVDQKAVRWQSRSHFYGIAAQLMRRILVDHARARGAIKRGSGDEKLSLDEAMTAAPDDTVDLLALDEALDRLSAMDPQQGRIVELRYFGGLTVDETAVVLGISPATVGRDWTLAKAWLHAELSGPKSKP